MHWKWLQRPRWAITAILLIVSIVFILWPVSVYRLKEPFDTSADIAPGRIRSENSAVNFKLSVHCFVSESEARLRFSEIWGKENLIAGVGEAAYWRRLEPHPNSHDLSFRRDNLMLYIRAFSDEPDADPVSILNAMIEAAKKLDAAVTDGQLRELRRALIPNGYLRVETFLNRRF